MTPNGSFAALVAGAHSISTRRLVLFLAGILLLSTTLLLFTSAHLSTDLPSIAFELPDSVAQLKGKVIPTIFKPVTHQPPPPANSTSSSDSWFAASFGWMNPLARSKDDRIALPPLERCPIYSYYEPPVDKAQAEIEDKMLLVWRRAWWAHGFKPMILGPAEAKTSEHYEIVYRAETLTPELKKELMRWLAWSRVDGGILVDHRVIPMGPHEDATITALRHCKFVYLNRFKNFSQKLYSSDKASLNKILLYISGNPPAADKKFTTVDEVISVLASPEDWIHVEAFPAALADYSPEMVKEKYKDLEPSALPNLVNAHLHSTFLSHYPDGVQVLTPFFEKISALYHPAVDLAHRIASCPLENPLPSSCPPNLPKCHPCKAIAPVKNTDKLTATTKSLTLGTIPHPFTTIELCNDAEISLLNDLQSRTLRWVRRSSKRDPWIKRATGQPYMQTGLGSGPRASRIKGLVAAKLDTKFLSMWSTDKEGFKDTEWTLGFVMPSIKDLRLNLPPAPGHQVKKIEASRKAVAAKGYGRIVKIVEGWNVADTEVWRFVNAWRERRILEREEWTMAERKFGQGMDATERR